jgi:hypothetical protein
MALSFVRELLLPLPAALLVLVLVAPVYFVVTRSRRSSSNPLIPTDWPIVELRGPPATSVRYLVTSTPANVRHIFTTNFANYVKGEELIAVLSILGGTIVAYCPTASPGAGSARPSIVS